MQKKVIGYLLTVFMLATLFTGCGSKKAEGKYLKLAKEVELASMDQHVATDGLSFEVIGSTIEGLYKVDKDGKSIPAIAESYEISEDGLVYTFKLRDAKWSNGEKVNAKDFVFSWKRLVDQHVASEYSFMADIAGIKNASKILAGEAPKETLGVKAVDDQTLQVELERPVPFFLSLTSFTAFLPLNEKFVEEQGDQYALEPKNLLANGPFKMAEWKKGYGYKLDKNPEYYEADQIQIDGLEFRTIKDYQTSALKYESDELDVVKLSAELVEKYKSNEGYTQIPAGYVWYMAPNNQREVFKNANIRKAISHAIDKDYIVNSILNDGSIAADFIVPKGLATGPDGKDFRETAGTYAQYNKDEALKYWNAGKQELGKDSVEIEVVFDDYETVKKMAEFIQAQLETNLPGLNVKLKAQPKKNRLALMRSGDYDLGITRWGPDYADPMTYLDMFSTENSFNYPKYSNKEYDQMIEDAKKGKLATDDKKRWEVLKDAEKILLEEGGIAPLYQRGYSMLINKKVKGIVSHQVGAPFSYENVTIEDE